MPGVRQPKRDIELGTGGDFVILMSTVVSVAYRSCQGSVLEKLITAEVRIRKL